MLLLTARVQERGWESASSDPGKGREKTEETAFACYEAACHRIDSRLAVTEADRIPFANLLARFPLDRFEQDVLWLLFLQQYSLRIRKALNKCGVAAGKSPEGPGLQIGPLLEILCPDSFGERMACRRYFTRDARLVTDHLINIGSAGSYLSVLDIPLCPSPRLISYLSGDDNHYEGSSSFLVEEPRERLDQVIMSDDQKKRAVSLVANHQNLIDQKKRIGLDSTIGYGNGLVILEYGPPGTGKTLFARALANAAGKPLLSILTLNASGRRRQRYSHDAYPDLRELFREARLRDGIVFLDECEHFAQKSSDELFVLLEELEKTEAIVILATNRPDLLAEPIDRRCTLKLPFVIPGQNERRRIWEILKPTGARFAEDVDLDLLAVNHPMAGGYIKNAMLTAVNAALARCPKGEPTLTQEDLEAGSLLQQKHLGGVCYYRKVSKPLVSIERACLNPDEAEKVLSIARWLRAHSAQALSSQKRPAVIANIEDGCKLLLHGYSEAVLHRAFNALAAELEREIVTVDLADILEYRSRQFSDPGVRDSNPFEVFESLKSGSQLPVILDRGESRELRPSEGRVMGIEFLHRFNVYGGVIIFASTAPRGRLSRTGLRYHKALRLCRPHLETRVAMWRLFAGDGVVNLSEQEVRRASCLELDYEESSSLIREAGVARLVDKRTGVPDLDDIRTAFSTRHREASTERNPFDMSG